MATKKQLAEQVLRKLEGGELTPDRQIDIREVMLDLDQLRDEYIKRLYYENMKQGTHVIDQEFLSEESVEITLNTFIDELTLNKATFSISASPISLPRNAGIQAVYEDALENPYIIIDQAQSGFMSKMAARNIGSNIGVIFKGNSATLVTDISPWFLPNIGELQMMRTNLYLNGIGNIDPFTAAYWSSSQVSSNQVSVLLMYSNTVQSITKNNTNSLVRKCRRFKAQPGRLSIGDKGLSGGYIFYYDSISGYYYEAAPTDDVNTNQWSNVDGTEIFAFSYGGDFEYMSDEIGGGIKNTYAIISQNGHTSSVAEDILKSHTATILMAKSSKDISESSDYPLSPDAESEILDMLFQKYAQHKQIPHDEVVDGQKPNLK
jgi:hypothetical protein